MAGGATNSQDTGTDYYVFGKKALRSRPDSGSPHIRTMPQKAQNRDRPKPDRSYSRSAGERDRTGPSSVSANLANNVGCCGSCRPVSAMWDR